MPENLTSNANLVYSEYPTREPGQVFTTINPLNDTIVLSGNSLNNHYVLSTVDLSELRNLNVTLAYKDYKGNLTVSVRDANNSEIEHFFHESDVDFQTNVGDAVLVAINSALETASQNYIIRS